MAEARSYAGSEGRSDYAPGFWGCGIAPAASAAGFAETGAVPFEAGVVTVAAGAGLGAAKASPLMPPRMTIGPSDGSWLDDAGIAATFS